MLPVNVHAGGKGILHPEVAGIRSAHLRVRKFSTQALAHETSIAVEVHGEAVLHACHQLSLHFNMALGAVHAQTDPDWDLATGSRVRSPC